MRTTPEAHQVIHDLYSIDHSSAKTEAVLDRLAYVLDARHATLGYTDPVRGIAWGYGSEGFRRANAFLVKHHQLEFKNAYRLSFARSLELGAEKLFEPEDLFHTISEMALRDRWLTDVQSILGYSTYLGGAFAAETSEIGFLGLGFENDRADDMAQLKQTEAFWLRHLSGASALHQRIRRTHAIEMALAKLKWGVLILDNAGFVIHSNPAAEAVIDGHSGLAIKAGRLRAPEWLLGELEACRLEGTDSRIRNTIGVLPDETARTDCVVFASAYSDADEALCDQTNGTLVFLLEAQSDLSDAVQAATALYRLTPAEQDCLSLLVKGHTRNQIAEIRSASPETIKSHTANLLQKMSCAKVTTAITRVSMLDPPLS